MCSKCGYDESSFVRPENLLSEYTPQGSTRHPGAVRAWRISLTYVAEPEQGMDVAGGAEAFVVFHARVITLLDGLQVQA